MKKLILLVLLLITPLVSYSQTPTLQVSYDLRATSLISPGFNIANRNISYHSFTWSLQQVGTVTPTLSTCTLVLQSSSDNSHWTVQSTQSCLSNGSVTALNFTANYVQFQLTALSFSVGSGMVTVNYTDFVTNPSTTAGVITPISVNNRQYCNQYTGATASIQIHNCAVAIPTTGGIVDANGFQGAQTWTTDAFNGITAPIDFLCEGATFTISTNSTLPSNVTLWGGKGCLLKPANGVTLTINGKINAPDTQQIFDISASGTVTVGAGALTSVYYPNWWGATATTADSTTAFQAAINAAKAMAGGNNSSYGAIVQFPAIGGQYHVSSLNATNFYGLTIKGGTTQGVTICGNKQSVSRPILDLTGSSAVILSGIIISTCDSPPSTLPTVGVLWSSSNSGGSCNKNRMDDVGVTGYYTVAAVYIYACTDSIVTGNAWQSQANGIPNLYINADNSAGVFSPYTTIITGSQSVNDWTFVQQEVHDLAGGGGASTSNPILLRGGSNLRFYGGIIATNGNAGVRWEPCTCTGGVGAPANYIFDGTLFYSDSGLTIPNWFYNNGTYVRNLKIRNLYANQGPILGGAANAQYDGLELTENQNIGATGGISITNATLATTVTIQNAILNLAGGAFTPGGSLKNVVLQNPGTITLQGGATWDNVIPLTTFTFANKPAFTVPGSQIFISDGTSPSSPCTNGGNGAVATYQNAALKCY